MTRICIIGGTAAYDLDLEAFATLARTMDMETPYGRAEYRGLVTPNGAQVLFTSRHGRSRLERSAAFVNHRATLWAARKLGAEAVLSWNGCGAIDRLLAVGDMLVPSDLIDQTSARVYSYRTPPGERPSPAWRAAGDALPGTPPPVFWESGRRALIAAARAQGHNVHAWGTYAATEGPRLESPAEIRMLADAGAAVVGMTLSPEVWLAQELGLNYASLCFVTNWATGLAGQYGNQRTFGTEVGVACLKVLMAAVEEIG